MVKCLSNKNELMSEQIKAISFDTGTVYWA
jgi:hypothetical protein